MTDPKTKTDKDAGNLSQTAKSYLRDLWIERTFGRVREFTSKAIEKGITNEEIAISMLSEHLDILLTKNQNAFANDFLTGSPDCIEDGVVYDTKCSYSLHTFFDACLTSDYAWQLKGYCELSGCKKGVLAYALTDMPEPMVQQEISMLKRKLGMPWDSDLPEELEQSLRRQCRYDDIPVRIKLFAVDFEKGCMEPVYARIKKCREYYRSLSLTPKPEVA